MLNKTITKKEWEWISDNFLNITVSEKKTYIFTQYASNFNDVKNQVSQVQIV